MCIKLAFASPKKREDEELYMPYTILRRIWIPLPENLYILIILKKCIIQISDNTISQLKFSRNLYKLYPKNALLCKCILQSDCEYRVGLKDFFQVR